MIVHMNHEQCTTALSICCVSHAGQAALLRQIEIALAPFHPVLNVVLVLLTLMHTLLSSVFRRTLSWCCCLKGDAASAPAIRSGDMVVFFEGREAIGFDRMKAKSIWQCRHGAFHHDEIVGKPFGSRVRYLEKSPWRKPYICFK